AGRNIRPLEQFRRASLPASTLLCINFRRAKVCPVFFRHRLSPAGGSQCENQNSKTTHRRLAAAARPLAARTTLAPPSKTLARNRKSCTGAEATTTQSL